MPPTLTTKSSDSISAPRFSIVTKALAGGGTEEEPRFKAIASSTITDRAGDEISLKALQQMASKFKDGITIFTDHENKVANAYGTTDSADILPGGTDANGNAVWDLHISGPVNAPSPNAMQLHRSISGGYVKLGCSIDAFVLDHVIKKSGGMSIDGLDVFAASIVGVPANQRSWTQKAVRAIKSFRPDEEDDNDMPPDETTEVAKEATETNWLDANATTSEADTVEETLDTADIVAETTEDATEKAASCPDCGKGHDAEGCDNGYHSTEKSVDSESGVQESESETPETTPTESEGTDTPETEKALTYSAEEVTALLKHVQTLVTEIGRLRDENAELHTKVASLTVENTTVNGEVELAKQVIEKVMAKPLQSKTAGYVNEFVEAHKLFDPDIADYLNKRGAIDNG